MHVCTHTLLVHYCILYNGDCTLAGFTATALLRQRPFNDAPATVIQRQSLDSATVVN